MKINRLRTGMDNDFETRSAISKCLTRLIFYALSTIEIHLIAQSIEINVNVWMVMH
jgi:hypothetical protein